MAKYWFGLGAMAMVAPDTGSSPVFTVNVLLAVWPTPMLMSFEMSTVVLFVTVTLTVVAAPPKLLVALMFMLMATGVAVVPVKVMSASPFESVIDPAGKVQFTKGLEFGAMVAP